MFVVFFLKFHIYINDVLWYIMKFSLGHFTLLFPPQNVVFTKKKFHYKVKIALCQMFVVLVKIDPFFPLISNHTETEILLLTKKFISIMVRKLQV